MMILQRYIFRELAITFVVAFAVLVAVCSVGLIFNMFRSTDAVTLSLIWDAIPVAFSYMAPWALIVAAALAGTMVYGRLAAENEIDAMRTSGIHMGRIVAPAILFAVAVFVLAFFAQHELAPWARFARRDIIGEAAIAMLKNPPSGERYIKLGGAHRLSYLDAKEGQIIEPTLLSFDKEGFPSQQLRGTAGIITVVDPVTVRIKILRATLKVWKMIDGNRVEEVVGFIGDREITIPIEDPNVREKSSEDFSGLELISEWSRSEGSSRRVLYTEFHLRLAKSLGPVCLILLAIPLGIRIKKGTKLSGLGVALPPLLIYFILFFIGQSLAQRRHVAPEIGAYGPNLVVLAAAAFQMWRVFRV